MRAVVLVVSVSACSLYFDSGHKPPASSPPDAAAVVPDASPPHPLPPDAFIANYDLVKTKAIAGEHQVAGIDSDRAGGLWIVYWQQASASYYDPADVWVTHLDANGVKLSEWYLHDDYSRISGLAFTGDALWINYTEGNTHLRKLDATTGATLGMFATGAQFVDISYDASRGEIVMSNIWNFLVALDPATGGQTWQAGVGFGSAESEQAGVAEANGLLWVLVAYHNRFLLVDRSGRIVSQATSTAVDTATQGQGQLAWDGQQLIVVDGNQIIWLDPRPL